MGRAHYYTNSLGCTQSQLYSWEEIQADLWALTKSLEQVQVVQDQLGRKEVQMPPWKTLN